MAISKCVYCLAWLALLIGNWFGPSLSVDVPSLIIGLLQVVVVTDLGEVFLKQLLL